MTAHIFSPSHDITYRDADGLDWEGVATRVGKVGGQVIYQVSLPADLYAPEKVLPMLARGLTGARIMLANYYEGRAP